MVYKIAHLSNEIKNFIYITVKENNFLQNISKLHHIIVDNSIEWDEEKYYQKHVKTYGKGNLIDLLKEYNVPLVWNISKESNEFKAHIGANCSLYNSARIEDHCLVFSSALSNVFESNDTHIYCSDNSILQLEKDETKFRDIEITFDQYVKLHKQYEISEELRKEIYSHCPNFLVEEKGTLPASFWEKLCLKSWDLNIPKLEEILNKPIKLNLPKKGSLVFVRNFEHEMWRAGYFSFYNGSNYIITFEGEEMDWKQMITELPEKN
jgi:hypothetical protein